MREVWECVRPGCVREAWVCEGGCIGGTLKGQEALSSRDWYGEAIERGKD